jgi:pimeloyl-ACP methyl ester carboxylesterase
MRTPLVTGLGCLLLATWGLSGCGHFVRLPGEVKRLESDYYLRGHVAELEPAAGPVVVVVYRQPPAARVTVVEVTNLGEGERDFAFSLPPATDYGVAAFQDRNGNTAYDPGEPWWRQGQPDPVVFGADRRSPRLEVRWQEGTMPATLREDLRAARAGEPAASADSTRLPVALGRLVDWSDPRFSPEAGSLGMWQPATALNRHGLGVWFVEPYDPGRIPVLLVPGIGGTASDWKPLAARLDRGKFQVWVYAYPSGLRIADSAKALEAAVNRLHERYAFARLDVVGHSMGGLVARKYILDAAESGHAGWLRNFVTLSTPWGGHEAAALGVEYAPAAIPAWLDLEKDSQFTRDLMARPLPAHVRHYLGFTFRGGNNPVLPASNDETVSVVSELLPAAQAAAVTMRGFDQTHGGILDDADAAKWVEQCLAQP